MKRYIFLLPLALIICFQSSINAQPGDMFNASWKKITSLEEKGLTASAQKEVETVMAMAAKNQDAPQEIKAIIYLMKYRNMVEEDAMVKNIRWVDSLLTGKKAPVKNVLQSILADMYNQYFQMNRYRLMNRGRAQVEDSLDIQTWSANALIEKAAILFQSSLENSKNLQQISIRDWEPILITGQNSRNLRPSLYDFLAFRAFDFFQDEVSGISRPAEKVLIREDGAFAAAPAFAQITFPQNRPDAFHQQALMIIQELIRFHLNDKEPDALLDADLSRLDFVRRVAVITDKEKKYEQALLDIEQRYQRHPSAARARSLRAGIYIERGRKYHPYNNPAPQFELRKALELCDETIRLYPGTEGAKACQNLKADILNPGLNLSTEQVNIPEQPFRTYLKYQNITKLYVRVIPVSKAEWQKLEEKNYELRWSEMSRLRPTREWQIDLPNLSDYQEHAIEFKNDALPAGMYIQLVSRNPDFSPGNNVMASQLIQVSSIAYINDQKNLHYIIHRETGKPLGGAILSVWNQEYNYQTRSREEKLYGRFTADDDGKVMISGLPKNRAYSIDIKWKKEELFGMNQEYATYYNSYEPSGKSSRTFFFTDRSIYRPGQTVYVKGIVIDTDRQDRSLRKNHQTSIQLLDANGQKAGQLQVTTNAFGSFQGSFVLPENQLTGQFSILDSSNQSSVSIQVEEYKRPAFFVSIDKPAAAYRMNDSITLKGKAMAYAGNSISNAQVTYRVIRKSVMPLWRPYDSFAGAWKGMPWHTEEAEVANGQSVTDATGNFDILFKAIPDESIPQSAEPVFHYEVIADVTDMNGETRSNQIMIPVSWHMFAIRIDIPEQAHPDSIPRTRIFTRNLQDTHIPAKLTLGIYALESPGRFVRTRYWDAPDQFIMGKEDFIRHFPHDPYQQEDNPVQWKQGEKIFELTDSSKVDGQFNIPARSWKDGWYVLKAVSTDNNGMKLSSEKIIRVRGGKTLLATDAHESLLQNQEALPGEYAQHSIQTSFDEVWVLYGIVRPVNDSSVVLRQIKKDKSLLVPIAVSEKDRGGISASYAFMKFNRLFSGTEYLPVKWSNKDLKVSVETYRDKTLPGSQEEWTISIKGPKADQQAAEALISMYDKSLDQFLPHNWFTVSNIWPRYSHGIHWQAPTCKAVQSQEYETIVRQPIELKPIVYDRLIDWNNYGNYVNDGIVRREMKVAAATAPAEAMMAGKKSDEKEEDGNASNKADSISQQKNEPGNVNQGRVRTDFRETAFFYPQLMTDSQGLIKFTFTIPDALTTWKMMAMAHTPDISSGYVSQDLITQKPLMVQPNMPRFLREGDDARWLLKIANTSEKEITGTVQLELFDASTKKPVDGWFKNVFPNQYVTVEPGKSSLVHFNLNVPHQFNGLLGWRVSVQSNDGQYRDAEENVLPVLSNRMLVTESLPIQIKPGEKKLFKMEKLLNANSPTLQRQSLTVTFTRNPSWLAVQSLPYLVEFPYECIEQEFNRFYANSLAESIAEKIPAIKTVFEKWKNTDSAALMSNLLKNQELKSALLQETPWVLEAQSETEQRRQIAVLFDLVRLSKEKNKTIQKLLEWQLPNGGFSWFGKGPDNRYITQYLLSGIGHLQHINSISSSDRQTLQPLINNALTYLDQRILEDYNNLIRSKVALSRQVPGPEQVQYLYMRSFFRNIPIKPGARKAFEYYQKQARLFWLKQPKNLQAMTALALHREGSTTSARNILRTLRENAIRHPELGMYWKDLSNRGYFWYQSAIENQALMIEAFHEIVKDNQLTDELRTWLLRQKQTHHWGTTRATAEACYAVLLTGSEWLSSKGTVWMSLGNVRINSDEEQAEAGTGYFSKRIPADQVQNSMGNWTVDMPATTEAQSGLRSWGAMYWQYFEDMDKISPAKTALGLEKKIMIEEAGPAGPTLRELKAGEQLRIGDKVVVRLVVSTDRDLEFIHLKDMRGACLEPVNVLSGHKWQGGLSYYESTRDLATHIFFDWLPRGRHVFEYKAFVGQPGKYLNGISSVQCMYAPEFAANSQGMVLDVKEPE